MNHKEILLENKLVKLSRFFKEQKMELLERHVNYSLLREDIQTSASTPIRNKNNYCQKCGASRKDHNSKIVFRLIKKKKKKERRAVIL